MCVLVVSGPDNVASDKSDVMRFLARRKNSGRQCWCWCSELILDWATVGIDHRCRAGDWLHRQSDNRADGHQDCETRAVEQVDQLGLAVAGYIWLPRYLGKWGSSSPLREQPRRGAFLIGTKALLNRARYVPCTRTALDWADTADLPSTTAGLQVQR